MDYAAVVNGSAHDLHVTNGPMNGVQVPDPSRHHLVYGPTPYVPNSLNYANEACPCVPVPPMQGPVQHYVTAQLPPPGIQQVYLEPGRPELYPHLQNAAVPTLNISGHLNPPPSFYYPPIKYPTHSEGPGSAKEKPDLLSRFGTYNGGRPNLDRTFPEIELAREYRQDLILAASFHPIWSLNSAVDFGQHIFMPNQPYVYTVVESVIHYYDQPYARWVNGKWISGKARLPLAHHVCVCLDDGMKRYEEVFRVGIMSADSPEGIYVPEESIVSVSVRLLKSAQYVRPTFAGAIRESLREIIPKHASMPMDFSVTREELAGNDLSGAIGEFVSGAQDPFETYFYPILQNVFQSFTVRLTQAHYIVTSHFYRPVLTGATSLLSSGDSQVLDVVKLDFCWEAHRIRGTASETALGRRAYDQQGVVSMVVTHSGSRLSNEGGPMRWTQLPPQCHPFINLTLNPALNRNFDPYSTYSFNIPTVFSSRTSAYPPSFRSVDCAEEPSPLPYFYPMPVPAPIPPQLFPYLSTHGDVEVEQYESGPEASSQTPRTALASSPTSMENPGATVNNYSNEIRQEVEEASEGSSLEISLDLDSKAPGSTTLNPNAQEFVPLSVIDSGYEGSALAEASSQTPRTSLASSPTSMENPGATVNNHSNEIRQEVEEASEGSSLEISLDVDSNAHCSTTLNPNAQEFVPLSVIDSGYEGSALAEASSQMPPNALAPASSPRSSVGFNSMALDHPRAKDNSSNETCPEDEGSEGSSFEMSFEMDSGYEGSETFDTTLSRSDREGSNNAITVPTVEPLSHSGPEEDSGTPSVSEDGSDFTEASTSPDLKTCLDPLAAADQTKEPADGMDPDEPPSVNSIQNLWSEEVEEINFSEAEPSQQISHDNEGNSCDSRPPTGRGGSGGTRGRGKRDSSWTQRSFPAKHDSLNWRRDSFNNGGQERGFEESRSSGRNRQNYYQRRNSSQVVGTSRSYNEHYEPNPSKPTDPPASYQSGRGRRGWGHNSGFESRFQQYEYPEKSPHFQSERSRQWYDTQANEKGLESGSTSSSLVHNQKSSAEEVRELDQGAPTIRPREVARDQLTKRGSEPNSAEESHGEAGTRLLITETTYTNSQNETYRNFNKNYGSRGHMRNYKSYEAGTRNNGDRADRSSEPSTVQAGRRRTDLGGQEQRQAESGHYGVKKPVAQNWANKKFRKFKMSNVGAEEESIMDAFVEPQEGNPSSHPHILSGRIPCPEDRPSTTEPPPSSPVQGPAAPTLEGHEIPESGGSGLSSPVPTQRKVRKPRWTKARRDAEASKSCSSDEGPRVGSTGSIPGRKSGPGGQEARIEAIAGDPEVNSGSFPRSGHGHGHGWSGRRQQPSN